MTIRVNEQLLLRTYQPEDAPELFQCVSDNRAHLREFLPWVDNTLKEADSVTFIGITMDQERDQKAMAMGIFLDNKLIGGIGMHEWNHSLKKCQIGYWLAERQQNKGYMYRSAVAFLDFLFHQLGMNKVEICFLPFNTRSGALAQKLGAKVEGVLRHNCRLHGSFEDTVIAGILGSEWKARKPEEAHQH